MIPRFKGKMFHLFEYFFICIINFTNSFLCSSSNVNLETLSSPLSREGQGERPPAESSQSICPTHEDPGELLRQAVEVQPSCDSELRGHAVLHAQRPRPAVRLHQEQVGLPCLCLVGTVRGV